VELEQSFTAKFPAPPESEQLAETAETEQSSAPALSAVAVEAVQQQGETTDLPLLVLELVELVVPEHQALSAALRYSTAAEVAEVVLQLEALEEAVLEELERCKATRAMVPSKARPPEAVAVAALDRGHSQHQTEDPDIPALLSSST
jgi:hypothetical protein